MNFNFAFLMPKLRDEILISDQGDYISLDYREQSCDINCPEAFALVLKTFMESLKRGFITINDLHKKFPSISDQIVPIIAELDKSGLITESEFPITDQAISGKQFYRELIRLYSKLKAKANSTFYNMLINKEANKAQLIGYAMEYYQLVKMAPGLIAPSLAKVETKKTRKLLQDFLRSELYHDKLLEESLTTVGVDINTLDFVQPLQSTFGICASLGVYAQQHPLTFKSGLFIFETPSPEFNQAFKERCMQLDMPYGFYNPILKHSDINDEGEHGSISKILLDEIGSISYEEQITVKKHFVILIESLIKQEDEIIQYYGQMTNFQPRLFY